MSMTKLKIPKDGDVIDFKKGKIITPNFPIIPYIVGDGIGLDVTPVMIKVLDFAVKKAYKNKKEIKWLEIFAGKSAHDLCGNLLPSETLKAMKKYRVSIKGPLTTPIGTGYKSINVSIRQELDLYACVRPIRYFPGTSSPMIDSSLTDMVIFRENTEDLYTGIEWKPNSDGAKKLIDFINNEFVKSPFRFEKDCGIGIKPVSKEGSERLIRLAINYAIDEHKTSVTIVHKGNIMKYTEGAFRDWGYELAKNEYNAKEVGDGEMLLIKNPETNEEILIKDCIADNFLQQIILSPEQHEVIATLNLNGDYISDALAAQVGGIGIAPGGNFGEGVAVFEATHGSAEAFAGKNRVNPGSIILSGEMMLRYLGWTEAADLVLNGVKGAIRNKQLTYDLARARAGRRIIRTKSKDKSTRTTEEMKQEMSKLVPGAWLVTTEGFGDAVINNM
ncbi:MAG: NADP-dependent isocitrate dehydrogenase [Pseudomonadota bacterium]|nr:NADP-dependent isocitrate dehydrogenase [Pseudomonadota bacterium]MEC8996717.1 NADP-dependent isocitrate dehydrogenase [Pseudomonadota bacterium]MED5275219.1 NADP-dependent isocitrate dehydrogenase [Pseudomonadota bacterium]MED5429983.1 NADP-dependent isocitrate dehydrogenase [Pseudomonadota bacterium]